MADFLTYLRALQKTEVPAGEVRTSWADYLERVRSKDETIYITLRGKRVAALTPAYVAEQYEADQEWYWTPEWRAGEVEADADIAAGRVTTAGSDEEFLAALGVEDE
jgi:prevent-host-death family protein